jgi:hypothetical protein
VTAHVIRVPLYRGRHHLLKDLVVAFHFSGYAVRIWSTEHRCWWRDDGCGYTRNLAEAGIYAFGDAYMRTRRCGPEKGIVFEIVGGWED